MIRKSIYPLEAVLPHIVCPDRPRGHVKSIVDGKTRYEKLRYNFDGDEIKMSSQRLYVFKEKGCDCVTCGIKGAFFAKEKHSEYDRNYHFNLYALDEDGNEVLMTKDHIIPRSKGGLDVIENYQPMCTRCNEKKGNEES